MSTVAEALDTLRRLSADGRLATLCDAHGVELLVAHGSALRTSGAGAPDDLDIAVLTTDGTDVLEFLHALSLQLGSDDVDLMDLRRAGPLARARALGPGCDVLHEAPPGTFATAQMYALTSEMDTRFLRDLDLHLLAGS